uniref:Uncharacterized protein n=1 Tax=Arundo donax TaxID=35708 RepID=A0A0A9FK88_ARUDO
MRVSTRWCCFFCPKQRFPCSILIAISVPWSLERK